MELELELELEVEVEVGEEEVMVMVVLAVAAARRTCTQPTCARRSIRMRSSSAVGRIRSFA